MLKKAAKVNNPWFLYGFILLIFFAEFFFFNKHVAHDITNFYPVSFDQASYLPVLYLTFENIKQYGLFTGLMNSPSLSTGILFPLQSSIAFFLFGASRHSVLLLNFLYFIALQICCLLAVKSVTKKDYFAIAFLGVLLTIHTPFLIYGGDIFDVRMDFMTFCLYGMVVSLIIKSEVFLNRKWTMIAAIVASLTILLRTLTLVYFAGVLISFGFYLLIKGKNRERLINVIIFSFLLILMTLPLIWFNRDTLYNYYIIGHILGQEKYIRMAEFGVTNTLSALIYYPGKLLVRHIGYIPFILCSVFFFVFLFLYPQQKDEKWRIGLIFIILSISIPMLALNMDACKSPVVAGIMAVPMLWLLFWDSMSADAHIRLTNKGKILLKSISWVVLFIGLFFQINALNEHYNKTKINELNTITKLYLDIGDYAVANNMQTFNIAIDQVCDYLTSGGIATVYYESKNKLLNINIERLGGMIFPITEEEALASLKRSNVFILNLGQYLDVYPYPFNESVNKLRPKLKQYAEQHFKILGDYNFKDSKYRVYVTR